jgi:hypothetical protein
MKTPIKTLIKALRVLENDIQSDDGVANAAISEAANRLDEQQNQIQRLVKAGDKLGPHGNGYCECVGGSFAACDHCRYAEEWIKAKEGL